MKAIFLSALMSAALFGAGEAAAQSPNSSPVLLIESLPSDNPDYRRMILVKYLSGPKVSVAYKAYTRSEFAQIADETPPETIAKCQAGAAATLAEIENFQEVETRREAQGEPPAATRFCIKNVPDWEATGRDRYLDPIFLGLPYAAVLKTESKSLSGN
ncbi:hypothetical protein [Litorimonas haliclonae]|uniref:hypothetical protein n=1 Tax=Litorimonas haliclonae TaxID=2081977 RepID=UPI0039EDF51C